MISKDMAIQSKGRVTFHKIVDGSYTYFRYSDDGGKTFTAAKPWTETGEYGNGRNLLINSAIFPSGKELTDKSSVSAGVWRAAGVSSMLRSAVDIADPPAECAGCTRAYQAVGIHTEKTNYDTECIGLDNFKYDTDSIYIYSCWARIVGGGEGYAGFALDNIRRRIDVDGTVKIMNNYSSTKLAADGSWTRITAGFVPSSLQGNIYIGILTGNTSATVQVCAPTVTKGGAVFPFSPAPEDQQFGLTPGKYLGVAVWATPYPPMDTSAYSWSEVQGKDGADAVSVSLSTELITVDTDDNGEVPPAALDNAYADVQAYRGNNPTTVTAKVIRTSAPGIGAMAEADRIKITAIGVDPSTGYAYGSGYVDIEAIVADTPYPLRLFIGTNLHKLTSKWVQDNKNFKSELGELQKDYNGKKTEWDTAIQQNSREIGLKVGKTEFDANNTKVSEQMARFKVEADRISAKVSETSERVYNMLKDTKTLRGDTVAGNGVTLADRAVKDFTVATGKNTGSEYLDVVGWNTIPVKPDTYYSLSFWAKGSGSFDCYLYPDACAEVVNSQGFTGTGGDGYNVFKLSPEWTFCRAVFKTKANVSGKKNLVPMRLKGTSSGSIYGVCLVESAAPSVWVPYHHNPKVNFVENPMGVFGRKNIVTAESTVDDETFGKVRQVSNTTQSDFQLLWGLGDFDMLNDATVTMYAVVREVTGGAVWNFGGWSTKVTANYGSFDYLSERSSYVDLGNGWRKYYTTFFNAGGNILWDGKSSFGLNSLKGTVQVHSVGVVRGDECPEWNAVPIEEALLATGIDITNKQVVVTSDNVVFRNNQGQTTAKLNMDGKLNTDLIDAKKVVTEGIKAQTIDAENATFNNVNVSGKVDAATGTIAGWKIQNGMIGRGESLDGMSLFDNQVIFNGDRMKRQAILGIANSLGTPFLAWLRDKTETIIAKYGMLVSLENGTGTNFALAATGGIIACDRGVHDYSLCRLTASSNELNLQQGSHFLVSGTNAVYIPRRSTVCRQLGIDNTKEFAVEVTVIAARGSGFSVFGKESGASGNDYIRILDNDGNVTGNGNYNGSISMGSGDTLKLALVYDGSDYYSYVISRST